jgi:hypothetical protein
MPNETDMIPAREDDLAELRSTLRAMLTDEDHRDLGRVLHRLLDSGHVTRVIGLAGNARYRINGITSLGDVEHFIATIQDPVQIAFFELAVLGKVHFWPAEPGRSPVPNLVFGVPRHIN